RNDLAGLRRALRVAAIAQLSDEVGFSCTENGQSLRLEPAYLGEYRGLVPPDVLVGDLVVPDADDGEHGDVDPMPGRFDPVQDPRHYPVVREGHDHLLGDAGAPYGEAQRLDGDVVGERTDELLCVEAAHALAAARATTGGDVEQVWLVGHR